MSRTLYTGAAGLAAQQYYMNNIGNNIANVNTTGYKPVVTSFSDLLYSKMYVKSADVLSGNGAKAGYGGINPSETSMVSTNNQLDAAISGKGWFAVETKNGVQYTRNGAFSFGLEGNGTVALVDAKGNYVLDANGQHITQALAVSPAADEENGDGETTDGNTMEVIDEVTGEVKTITKPYNADEGALMARVGVFDFPNPEALTPLSASLYASNAQSGNATADTDPHIQTGYLEQSGATMVDGMVDLITAQRAYQLSAKVVQTADEDEQTVNNLRA